MKVLRNFLLLTLLLLAPILSAQTNSLRDIFLEWDNSPDPTVTGYRIYWGGVTNVGTNKLYVYTNTVDAKLGDSNVLAYLTSKGYVIAATSTVSAVSNLMPRLTYFFYVTAYEAAGLESDPSNVIEYMVPFRGPRRAIYLPLRR